MVQGTPRKQERTQLDIKDTEQLSELLREAGIDLAAWGVGKAKSVGHLMNEINEHESTMYRTDGNGLLRSLEYVAVEMHYNHRILVETHQEIDGRVRQRFTLLSEKMHAGETWQVSATPNARTRKTFTRSHARHRGTSSACAISKARGSG